MSEPVLKTKVNRDHTTLERRMNAWDKTLAFFNPRAAGRNMLAREALIQLGYNDVSGRRSSSGGMYGNAAGESWNANRDRLKSMWDARDACKFDFIGGMMARITLYVCGIITHSSNTGDEGTDEAYDEYWKNWSGEEVADDGLTQCDITGRHTLAKMVQLAFLEYLIDGDHGIIEVDPALSPTGVFCLQNIEADRIGSPLEAQVEENYIGGVGLDPETGRVQFYRVFKRTRMNMWEDPQPKPVDAFIHVWDADRTDEYRGRTKLLRLLNDARDIREWIEAEKIAGKTQSQFAAIFGVKDPFSTQGPAAWKNNPSSGTPIQDANFGKILKAAEGEVFSMLAPPSRPSGGFMAFVQLLIRKMATSLDLPYGFLWDLATLGGVTARIEVQQALRKIQYWQKNIIVEKILTRVRNKVISQGIARQELPPHPNWKRHGWHFGPWISTDVGYEAEVDSQSISFGTGDIAEVIAKHGKTPRQVFSSNAATANVAISVGTENEMPVEVFAPGMFPTITQQRAAMVDSTQPPPLPPPPGSIEALDVKGVQELLKLIQSVKDGKMDHDSCVATLKLTFHLSQKQAEDITPPNPTKKEIEAAQPAPARPQQVNSPKPKPKR